MSLDISAPTAWAARLEDLYEPTPVKTEANRLLSTGSFSSSAVARSPILLFKGLQFLTSSFVLLCTRSTHRREVPCQEQGPRGDSGAGRQHFFNENRKCAWRGGGRAPSMRGGGLHRARGHHPLQGGGRCLQGAPLSPRQRQLVRTLSPLQQGRGRSIALVNGKSCEAREGG